MGWTVHRVAASRALATVPFGAFAAVLGESMARGSGDRFSILHDALAELSGSDGAPVLITHRRRPSARRRRRGARAARGAVRARGHGHGATERGVPRRRHGVVEGRPRGADRPRPAEGRRRRGSCSRPSRWAGRHRHPPPPRGEDRREPALPPRGGAGRARARRAGRAGQRLDVGRSDHGRTRGRRPRPAAASPRSTRSSVASSMWWRSSEPIGVSLLNSLCDLAAVRSCESEGHRRDAAFRSAAGRPARAPALCGRRARRDEPHHVDGARERSRRRSPRNRRSSRSATGCAPRLCSSRQRPPPMSNCSLAASAEARALADLDLAERLGRAAVAAGGGVAATVDLVETLHWRGEHGEVIALVESARRSTSASADDAATRRDASRPNRSSGGRATSTRRSPGSRRESSGADPRGKASSAASTR